MRYYIAQYVDDVVIYVVIDNRENRVIKKFYDNDTRKGSAREKADLLVELLEG